LVPQFTVGVGEVDNAVKAAGSSQDRRVENGGFVRCCHNYNSLATANAVEAIEELL
jgi:hypothetical protein